MTGPAMGPGAMDALRQKERAMVEEQMRDGDEVLGAIIGAGNQVLVALGDRLVIAKSGFMSGATGGGRASTYHYRDIVSIEQNAGMTNAVIEVLTAAHSGGREKDFWAMDKDRDPWKLNHCLPTTKGDLKASQPLLDQVRDRIADSKKPVSESQGAGAGLDIANQLTALAELHRAGALSDEEFTNAKRKLIE